MQNVEFGPDGRPEFLVKLGVMLPCTPDDVKQAYLVKVRSVHPDRGGTQEQFIEVQQAFERATEYAHFLSGRRKWLGAQIERYAEQEEAVAAMRAAGAVVEYEHKDWLSREIGEDFAQVLDVVVKIRWTGPRVGDEQIAFLVDRRDVFKALRSLNLSLSNVTDEGVLTLATFPNLDELVLQETGVTHHALALLDSLSLSRLDIRGAKVGGFRLMFIRRNHPDVEILH